ncbi:hypothetical protein ACFLZM_00105 [Thermodesulfobacteriota bacterium]
MLIIYLLEFAGVGGMPKERRKEIYYEIMDHYTELRIDVTEPFLRDIVEIGNSSEKRH